MTPRPATAPLWLLSVVVMLPLVVLGGPALVESSAATEQQLGLLKDKLDSVAPVLATLQQAALTAGWLQPGQVCSGAQTTQPLIHRCDLNPSPLPVDGAPYQEPAVLACARSCLQLRDQGGSLQDGVYWFTGMPVPVLCDFSHDGGGWTLLLAAVTGDGWDQLSALGRNRRSPSLTDNYSILQEADAIRDLGNSNRFAYRMEGQAQTGRQRWGGIWLAPRDYSFVHESPSQTDVTRYRKFDIWDYKNEGIEKRMPWINTGTFNAVLTTSASATKDWWGTLVSFNTPIDYRHSPWLDNEAYHSGTVLYWMREEEV